jgi:predicted dehydrogenase
VTSFPNSLPEPRTIPLRGGAVLRWGILAPGEIARDFTSTMHANTDQRVHAVASRSAARAEQFAATHGIPRWYDSYEALVADPDIDVVYVSAPHSEHARLALLAIQAGKHVLVEKPLAMTEAEARVIVQAARTAGVFAMEAMWSRFLPQTDVAAQLLEDGALGDLRSASADFGAAFPFEPEGRGFNPALGGGALLDLGVYAVWFAVFALGAPQRVTARGSLAVTGVDAQSVLILDYPPNAQALVSTSLLVATPGVGMIAGTDARLEFDPLFLMPGAVTLVNAHGGDRLTWRDESGLAGRDGLAWEAAAVAQHIADGLTESPVHPLDTSLQVLHVIDVARAQLGYPA